MPSKPRCDADPFKSPTPVKAIKLSTPAAISYTRARQPVYDVLATADLFLEQLKELEDLRSTVEERVQRKRQALKELEYLILGLNSDDKSPYGPVCPNNTPIRSRLPLVSPRLRGLFDLHGPGQVNTDATQTCLDYSPEIQVGVKLGVYDNLGRSEEWVDDDDEEALLSPFDDKHAPGPSPPKLEKDLPAIPHERTRGILESKIPRKIHVRRQVSVSRRATIRSVTQSTSRGRWSGIHNVTAAGAPSDVTKKGTIRRGSWKPGVENAKKKTANENESGKDSDRKKKKKGLWSIYSVCSELGGLNSAGTHYHHAV